eukprot:6190227-Pleurochrysis_carterae.AAC.2
MRRAVSLRPSSSRGRCARIWSLIGGSSCARPNRCASSAASTAARPRSRPVSLPATLSSPSGACRHARAWAADSV